MAQPNGLLRARREHIPSRWTPGECMSRRELAEAVNAWLWDTTGKRYELDAHSIARYERGAVRWPGAAYRSGLRHVLATSTDAELGFWPVRREPPPAESRREPTDSGQSRKLAGTPRAATAGLFPDGADAESLERLASVAWRPSRVDRSTVEHLELVTQTHRRLYHDLSSVKLVAAVIGHFQLTALLLGSTQRLPLCRRLAAVAGETAGHAAWLFHDLGDQTAASRYYAMADAATRRACDPLSAYVRGFRSLAVGSDGQLRQALVLARDAVETAGRTATATTRAWLAGLEARAWASVNDRKACSATLLQAETAIGQARREEDPAWMYEFDHPRLLAVAGACYGQLGSTAAAERTLREALEALGMGRNRRRAEVLVDLARVRVRQQDVDEAAGLARESLAIAVETGSMAGIRRIQRFRPLLAQWTSTQSIRILDEQLDGVG